MKYLWDLPSSIKTPFLLVLPLKDKINRQIDEQVSQSVLYSDAVDDEPAMRLTGIIEMLREQIKESAF
jgi:hypothetical protein